MHTCSVLLYEVCSASFVFNTHCKTLEAHRQVVMQDDMDVMFDNAMAYNQPDTVYHKQARSLKAVAAKMVDLAKEGVTDFR